MRAMTVATTTAKDQYDVWHAGHEVDQSADAPWHRLVLAHLNHDRDLKAKRVLEVACGRGGFAAKLMRTTDPSPRLVAADFSSTAITKGKSFAANLALSGIRWEVADAQALGHPDASFDTVISCETIEHLPDPRAAIAEFCRVLKPSGRLLLTTPNYMGPMGCYRGYLRAVGRRYTEGGQPINRFMLLPQTVSWIGRAGLRVVKVGGCGHYLPWPGRPPREIRLLDRFHWLRWVALHSLVVAEKRAHR
jgi:ubiquinone/menaquinone biosynthesis C-methylase UbiE